MSPRWPWKRPEPDTAGLEEARQELAQARANNPRVTRVVEAHHRKQRENHFGEQFARAIGGNR